jgi:hypothetical protein
MPVAFNLDDYEPVAHRLDRWLKDCHVRGVQPRVLTDLVHYLQNSAVFSASLFEGDVLIATGWAEEIRGEGHINKTSHLENCETGAVGRALANAGYAGSDLNKRPSREEMSKVQRVSTTSSDGVTTERPANAPSDKQVWLYKKLLNGTLRDHLSDVINERNELLRKVESLQAMLYKESIKVGLMQTRIDELTIQLAALWKVDND